MQKNHTETLQELNIYIYLCFYKCKRDGIKYTILFFYSKNGESLNTSMLDNYCINWWNNTLVNSIFLLRLKLPWLRWPKTYIPVMRHTTSDNSSRSTLMSKSENKMQKNHTETLQELNIYIYICFYKCKRDGIKYTILFFYSKNGENGKHQTVHDWPPWP
jgi:hypothetical protein